MQKVVLDTNLYIDWLNDGLHQDLLLGPGRVRYLSAVVVLELRVGARTPAARKALERVVAAYAGSKRLVAPAASIFEQAGGVLARLETTGHSIRRSAVTHDVLIALTARSLGATLWTRDAKDFAAIREATDFELEVVA